VVPVYRRCRKSRKSARESVVAPSVVAAASPPPKPFDTKRESDDEDIAATE
jgi:hypothetical protein